VTVPHPHDFSVNGQRRGGANPSCIFASSVVCFLQNLEFKITTKETQVAPRKTTQAFETPTLLRYLSAAFFAHFASVFRKG
jgi:hypothetical protein